MVPDSYMCDINLDVLVFIFFVLIFHVRWNIETQSRKSSLDLTDMYTNRSDWLEPISRRALQPIAAERRFETGAIFTGRS